MTKEKPYFVLDDPKSARVTIGPYKTTHRCTSKRCQSHCVTDCETFDRSDLIGKTFRDRCFLYGFFIRVEPVPVKQE